MEQIDYKVVLQAAIEKKERLIQERKLLTADIDSQISELSKFIEKYGNGKKSDVSTPSHDMVIKSLSGKIIHLFEVKKQALSNNTIVGVTGASGPQVSSALYRIKGKKVLAEGDNKKAMIWGLKEWFDDKDRLLEKYKPKE